MPEPETPPKTHFIRRIIEEDLGSGKHAGVVTRFPPEPNGYLHIGHAKSICLNFDMAESFGGHCNLRFDDTNPEKEEAEYARAIEEDVRWLGYEWRNLCHASDYFEQLHDHAVALIRSGHAYVDSQDGDTIRETRGTLTEPGSASPYRDRGVEENLDLFARMKAGGIPRGGARAARAHQHGCRQHQHARPGAVPHPPPAPPPYRRRLVDLPPVRLHPLPVRLAGGHHPFPVHARVRGPPPAVRLDPRSAGRALPSAADRVRPPVTGIHRGQQAPAAAPGPGRPRGRLGRPAAADPAQPPPSRLHPRVDPEVLRRHRRHQERQSHFHGRAGRQHPQRPECRSAPA